jgi:hypothetical protein
MAEMDEVRVFGYCENCGMEVTDEGKEYCVTDDGKVFCSVECALEHFGVTKIEV